MFVRKKINLNELMKRSFSRCQKGSCILTFCGILILRGKAKESLVKYVRTPGKWNFNGHPKVRHVNRALKHD